ncbi:MAG: arsenate reductase (glutaredoxin) [Proteobacteria bacterium]|nr:arsenate reductase (glutaredoxin) [Pseudomonadota bacterium]
MSITIYHNPRCSKSRQTLALLQDRGLEPTVVQYLENPPDTGTLRRLAVQLGVSARELLRDNEAKYQELGLADDALSEDDVFTAIAAHPELLQRPIVVANEQARFGRPPESVLEIIEPA